MNNKTHPCLVWSQTPKPSPFGLGGEATHSSPMCQLCEVPMSHIGVFPWNSEVLQVFYCWGCQPLLIETEKLSLKSKKKVKGGSVRSLSPAQHEDLVSLFEKQIKQNEKDQKWDQHPNPQDSKNKANNVQEDPQDVLIQKPDVPVHSRFSPPKDFFDTSFSSFPNLFLPLSPKAQSLSTNNALYTHSASLGVYTQGRTKNPSPVCPCCHSQMSLFLHVDSVSHDFISFEDMGALCVYCCRAHPSLFVLKVEK